MAFPLLAAHFFRAAGAPGLAVAAFTLFSALVFPGRRMKQRCRTGGSCTTTGRLPVVADGRR